MVFFYFGPTYIDRIIYIMENQLKGFSDISIAIRYP